MNKHVLKTVLCAFAINCLSLTSMADNLSAEQNWLRIGNSPQCAVDMKQPTDSIFVTAALKDYGSILVDLAKKSNLDPGLFAGEGLKFYKTKMTTLAQIIIDGLNNGTLNLITQKSQAQNEWLKLNESAGSNKYFEKTNCTQVNEINSYYSPLFLRGLNKEVLTEMAEKFIVAKTQTNCDVKNIKNDLDLYPVYNYDLKITDQKKWQTNGFEFWTSFKIYFSYAWRNSKNAMIINHPMNKWTLVSPMEEQILLLSNGCKSIERPECNSDFLSSAELRNLFTTDRSKLELTSSTLEMKDLIMDNNDKTDQRIQDNMKIKSGDQKWISDFQKSYLGFSTNQIDNLFKANKLFSSMTAQKNNLQISQDLTIEMSRPENFEEAHYLCTEHRLLTQEQPLNVYKFDLDNLKTNGSKMDGYLKFGMTVSDILTSYTESSRLLTSLCEKLDQNQKNQSDYKWNNYRPWYKSFLSRYQIITAAIEVEKQESPPETLIDLRPMAYLKDQCATAIDCHRKMTESIVHLNKLLIHSRTFLRSDIQSPPLFNERAEKIACGMYDPFEVSRLNKKNLIAGGATALAFGFTNLPIYLDIQYKPKELISFNKLVQDRQIKFDPQFSKDKISKTISLSLGSFINVPCSVSISETDANLSDVNSSYVFRGLGINTCQAKKNQTIESPTGAIDVFKKDPKSDMQVCGQCTLNFEKISILDSFKNFWILRPFIIIADKLIKYQSIKNDDTINPRQFNVSTKYLLETYKKNNNTIPEKCVPMLSRGLSCQSNICESLAVKEFEIKSGLSVENIELGKSKIESGTDSFDSAWISVKGCDKKMKMTLNCSGNGDSFWMPVAEREYKQCKGN